MDLITQLIRLLDETIGQFVAGLWAGYALGIVTWLSVTVIRMEMEDSDNDDASNDKQP